MPNTKTTKSDGRAFKGVAVRTDDGDLEARLDRVAAELTKRAAGVPQRRTAVARSAMLRGLEAMERELDIR
jgi:hypothetical protein